MPPPAHRRLRGSLAGHPSPSHGIASSPGGHAASGAAALHPAPVRCSTTTRCSGCEAQRAPRPPPLELGLTPAHGVWFASAGPVALSTRSSRRGVEGAGGVHPRLLRPGRVTRCSLALRSLAPHLLSSPSSGRLHRRLAITAASPPQRSARSTSSRLLSPSCSFGNRRRFQLQCAAWRSATSATDPADLDRRCGVTASGDRPAPWRLRRPRVNIGSASSAFVPTTIPASHDASHRPAPAW